MTDTDLIWAGITPPTRGQKTICPKCSHTRKNATQRCLKIYDDRAYCFHCQWEKRFD